MICYFAYFQTFKHHFVCVQKGKAMFYHPPSSSRTQKLHPFSYFYCPFLSFFAQPPPTLLHYLFCLADTCHRYHIIFLQKINLTYSYILYDNSSCKYLHHIYCHGFGNIFILFLAAWIWKNFILLLRAMRYTASIVNKLSPESPVNHWRHMCAIAWTKLSYLHSAWTIWYS